MSKFSDFVRKASPEKREEIMAKVMDDANAEQAMQMLVVAQDEEIDRLTTEGEMMRKVLQQIADSGIENNSAWAWIGGKAKQVLKTAQVGQDTQSGDKDTQKCQHKDITLRCDIDEYECLGCGKILYDGPTAS